MVKQREPERLIGAEFDVPNEPADAGSTGGARPGRRIVGGRERELQVRDAKPNAFSLRRQREFLEHLGATCNVTLSAARVGVGKRTVYHQRMKSEIFRTAWNEALREGYARLEMLLLQHATAGDSPLFVGGEEVEDDTPFDKHLALELLKQHRGQARTGRERKAHNRRELSIEEVKADLLKRLSHLNKRHGGEG